MSSLSVVFLDIDGVLYNNRQNDDVDKVVERLYPNRGEDKLSHTQMSRAHTHLFSKEAVANLESLIQKVENVAIVIASSWVSGSQSLETVRQVFALHSFSRAIIDKVPTADDREFAAFRKKSENKDLDERTAQISYLLLKNPTFANFVILDDYDHRGFKEKFGNRFIQVDGKKLLSTIDVEQAIAVLCPR